MGSDRRLSGSEPLAPTGARHSLFHGAKCGKSAPFVSQNLWCRDRVFPCCPMHGFTYYSSFVDPTDGSYGSVSLAGGSRWH